MQIKHLVRQLLVSQGLQLSKSKPTSDENLRAFFSTLRSGSANVDLMRVGGNGDGGYLLPDNLDGVTTCFSPGVADSSGFEWELAEKFGMKAFLADYSVDGPAVENENFIFVKKFLGSWNDEQTIRLEDWVEGIDVDSQGKGLGTGDYLLQMDIEGAEYPVLIDTPDHIFKKFRIVTIEFHYLERVFDRNEFSIIKMIFDRLLQHFAIVHVHPNNCCPVFKRGEIEMPSVIEFTFLRRDCLTNPVTPLTFEAHPLDQRNVPQKPDIELADCWRN